MSMHIVKENIRTGKRVSYCYTRTPDLLITISKRNEYLSPEQVNIHLHAGSTIYTHFSKYYKARN